MDSDGSSVTGTKGGRFRAMAKKKQVGNIKLVPRSVVNNIQEPRMMVPNQVCFPSLHGHITQIGVMIYLPHTSYHLLHLIVIHPIWD